MFGVASAYTLPIHMYFSGRSGTRTGTKNRELTKKNTVSSDLLISPGKSDSSRKTK